MRIVILESDGALALFLQRGLRLEGHDATCCSDAEHALEQCRQKHPHLVVLGLSLRDELSFQVIANLREASGQAGLLVLTDSCEIQDKIRCLDAGADDCLIKPFSFHELAARCRALLRRVSLRPEAVRHLPGWDLDLMERKVKCAGKELSLTQKEFSLLECLLRQNGACCTRQELLVEVWKEQKPAATNVVDVYINYLRRKIALVCGSEASSQIIETVRGAGYRIRPISGYANDRTFHSIDLALGA